MQLSYSNLLVPTYQILFVVARGTLNVKKLTQVAEAINEQAKRTNAKYVIMDYRFLKLSLWASPRVEAFIKDRAPGIPTSTRYAWVVKPGHLLLARALANLYTRKGIQVGVFTEVTPAAAFLGCDIPFSL